jgi:hypothetical protein
MKKIWRDPQNVIAVGVTLISVCALIVSITQTRVMIRQSDLMDVQARSSVLPILKLATSKAFDPDTGQLVKFRISATNYGVGPASIDDVYVEYKGEAVQDWGDLFNRFNINDTIPTYVDNSNLNKSIIQAGESVAILDLTENILLGRAIHELIGNIQVKVLYSSIYGDQFEWRNTSDGWENVAVEGAKKSFGKRGFRN